MRALEEKSKKSKILEQLNLTTNQLEFHGPDSFNATRRYNSFDNLVHRTFCNELKDIEFIEMDGQLYSVIRKGYENVVILKPVK